MLGSLEDVVVLRVIANACYLMDASWYSAAFSSQSEALAAYRLRSYPIKTTKTANISTYINTQLIVLIIFNRGEV